MTHVDPLPAEATPTSACVPTQCTVAFSNSCPLPWARGATWALFTALALLLLQYPYLPVEPQVPASPEFCFICSFLFFLTQPFAEIF